MFGSAHQLARALAGFQVDPIYSGRREPSFGCSQLGPRSMIDRSGADKSGLVSPVQRSLGTVSANGPIKFSECRVP